MLRGRHDNAPRPRRRDQFVDLRQRRRLAPRGEERREHGGRLLRTETLPRLGRLGGGRRQPQPGEFQESARTHRLALRGGLEKFPRARVVAGGPLQQADRREQVRVALAADVGHRHRGARRRDLAGEAQRVARDAARLGLGCLAQLKRRRLGQFFPFARLNARQHIVREVHVAADRQQHVAVALLETVLEQRLRHRLAIEPAEKGEKIFLVFPLVAVEAPVHERVGLLRPRAPERAQRFGRVMGHGKELFHRKQPALRQRRVEIAVFRRRRPADARLVERGLLGGKGVGVLHLADGDRGLRHLHRHEDLRHAFLEPRRSTRLDAAQQKPDVFAVELAIGVDLETRIAAAQARPVFSGSGRQGGRGRPAFGRAEVEHLRLEIDHDGRLLAGPQRQAGHGAVRPLLPRRDERVKLGAFSAEDQRGRHRVFLLHARPHQTQREIEPLKVAHQPLRRLLRGVRQHLKPRDAAVIPGLRRRQLAPVGDRVGGQLDDVAGRLGGPEPRRAPQTTHHQQRTPRKPAEIHTGQETDGAAESLTTPEQKKPTGRTQPHKPPPPPRPDPGARSPASLRPQASPRDTGG